VRAPRVLGASAAALKDRLEAIEAALGVGACKGTIEGADDAVINSSASGNRSDSSSSNSSSNIHADRREESSRSGGSDGSSGSRRRQALFSSAEPGEARGSRSSASESAGVGQRADLLALLLQLPWLLTLSPGQLYARIETLVNGLGAPRLQVRVICNQAATTTCFVMGALQIHPLQWSKSSINSLFTPAQCSPWVWFKRLSKPSVATPSCFSHPTSYQPSSRLWRHS
jgi:hypothetical protein